MGDPLSVAGGVVGIISSGIQITQVLVDFYTAYRSQYSEVAATIRRLHGLAELLRSLQVGLQKRNFSSSEHGLLQSTEESIANCDEAIQELQRECQKFQKVRSTGTQATLKGIGHRIAYPFRTSTLQRLEEDIGEIRANLSLALEVLQQNHSLTSQETIDEIKNLLEVVKGNHNSSTVQAWFHPPDAGLDHNTACNKKHPGTGAWLTKGNDFAKWLQEPNSILWMRGFAGSGKSILCSTAIQAVFRHRENRRDVGIAFFYFTFNDDSKRDESSILRALIWQLSCQLAYFYGHEDIERLRESHGTAIPPLQALLACLQRLVQRFRRTYILLDALDECPLSGSRELVLGTLETMHSWDIPTLHILITSRDEADIRDSLEPISSYKITMRNVGIDKDIADFISGQLVENRRLQKLSRFRDLIQNALIMGAKGMFRWVECQLKSLQSCPPSEHYLEKILNTLPQSLDATYERMFCGIEEYLIEDTRRMLTLLCFTTRPITVAELLEGLAVDEKGLNRKRRLPSASAILDIWSGFIDIVPYLEGKVVDTDPLDDETLCEAEGFEDDLSVIPMDPRRLNVQIAHFSVQEYLESERIKHQKAAVFSLKSTPAHAEIAQICLTYLLDPTLAGPTLSLVQRHPFSNFAASHWYDHYRAGETSASVLNASILKLFEDRHLFVNWVKLNNFDRFHTSGFYRHPWRAFDENDNARTLEIASSIYYAALLGLDQTLLDLIDRQPIAKRAELLNEKGGRMGFALAAAARRGRNKTVQILLDNGADLHPWENLTSALGAAARQGHEQTVRLLLDRGCEVDQTDGYGSTALQLAAYGNQVIVVELLLDRDANVNLPQNGEFGSPLQAASCSGSEEIVQMLLEHGAEVSTPRGKYVSALQYASRRRNESIVRMLLEHGANVNFLGLADSRSALQEASDSGCKEVVQMLLTYGADVNFFNVRGRSALQEAANAGHEDIARVLISHGADINAQRLGHGNALTLAAASGRGKIVQILLEHGADVNAKQKKRTPLIAAAERGHREILQMLLEYGAHVDAQCKGRRTALVAASENGHDVAVETLLKHGAVANAEGVDHGFALEAACRKGHQGVVRLLLNYNADIDTQGRRHGRALKAAAFGGHAAVMRMLEDHCAESDRDGDSQTLVEGMSNSDVNRNIQGDNNWEDHEDKDERDEGGIAGTKD